MTEQEAADLAESLKIAVYVRTGLSSRMLVCPREKSMMTPCVARDGRLAVVLAGGHPICVGCEADLVALVQQERTRTPPGQEDR